MPESAPPPAPSALPVSNRSWRGWWRFIAVGLGGYVVLTLGVVGLVEVAGLGKRPAYAIMILLVMALNFYFSRAHVFPHGRTGKPARQAMRFLVVASSSRVAEYVSYSFLIGPGVEMPYVAALTLVSALSYLAKFYLFSAWVFR